MENCYAIYKTDIGYIKIDYNQNAIIGLKIIIDTDVNNEGIKTELTTKTFTQVNEYLNGERKQFNIPIAPQGTEFQKKVWQALCNIPYGKTVSYKEIAEKIGNDKACRAVGMANNKNPIMIIIPCHRVIGKNGKLTGYAGGLDLKSFLLDLEKKNEL